MEDNFSKSQKKQLRSLYDRSYQNECTANMKRIIALVKAWQEGTIPVDEAWEQISQFAHEKSREMYGRYQFRYSTIIVTLAVQYQQGYLTDADMDELDEELRNRIKKTIQISNETK